MLSMKLYLAISLLKLKCPLSENARLIEVSESLYDYVTEFGSVWLAPNNDNAYKTYDANELRARKLKLK